MGCSHASVPIPLDLPSVFGALDQEIFFSLKFLAPSGPEEICSLLTFGNFWSCTKNIHLFRSKCRKGRNAFKEADCQPSFASLATLFLTCCFYFWSTPFQLTLTCSQMRHLTTGVLRSSWQTLLPAVTSAAPVLPPHRHSTDSCSA